jgi:hypothetical protein
MSKFDKLIIKLLSGIADGNFSFEDLRYVLLYFGFTERTTGGSHRIFYKDVELKKLLIFSQRETKQSHIR